MLQSLGRRTGWRHQSVYNDITPHNTRGVASAIHRGLRRTRGAPEPSYGGRSRPSRPDGSESRGGFSFKSKERFANGGRGREQQRERERRPSIDGAPANEWRKERGQTGAGLRGGYPRVDRDEGATRLRRPISSGRKSDEAYGARFAGSRKASVTGSRDERPGTRERRPSAANSSRYAGTQEPPAVPGMAKSEFLERRLKRWEGAVASPRKKSRDRGLRDDEFDDLDGDSESRQRDRRRKDNTPTSITYTTPASEFLYGTSVVEAALRANRRKLYKLYMLGGGKKKDRENYWKMQELAMKRGVQVIMAENDSLMDKMSTGRPHNGYVLEASPLKKPPVQALLEVDGLNAREFTFEPGQQSPEALDINGAENTIQAQSTQERYPFVLFLDGVQDTGNLGGIIRTAHFLGVDAVVMSTTCAPLNAVVLKASAGSAESMPLLYVSDTSNFVRHSKDNGWDFYASVASPSEQSKPKTRKSKHRIAETMESPLRKWPCVLMIGGEGTGLKQDLVKKADLTVSIAGFRRFKTTVDSLNVSVATGILANAFLRLPPRQPDVQETDAEEDEKDVVAQDKRTLDGVAHQELQDLADEHASVSSVGEQRQDATTEPKLF